MNLKDIDVLILCGGKGSRFRSEIEDFPKGLAPIGGKPILEILTDDLVFQGFRRIILGVGHFRKHIINHYKGRNDAEYSFSIEETPLGTGGAVKYAEKRIQSDCALVLNGDSICKVDYGNFLKFHQSKQSFLSIVTSYSENTMDCGSIVLNSDQKILSFQEKVSSQKMTLINAGIYILSLQALKKMDSSSVFSLENDFFPVVIREENCFGYKVRSEVLDIGTPERYQKINQKINQKFLT